VDHQHLLQHKEHMLLRRVQDWPAAGFFGLLVQQRYVVRGQPQGHSTIAW